MEETKSEQTKLRHTWTFWFHKLYDDSWTPESYENLGSFNTIEGFFRHYHAITPYIDKGLLFLMREGIFPNWEDPQNLEGSSLSFMNATTDFKGDWKQLCMAIISNRFLKEPDRINGVSSCPKPRLQKYLFKLWMTDKNPILKIEAKEFNIDLSKVKQKIYSEQDY